MRQWLMHIALWMCLLAAAGLAAQERTEASLDVVRGDDGRIEVHFALGDVTVSHLPDGTASMQCTGMANLAEAEGLPALPSLSRLIVLPRGSRLAIVPGTLRSSKSIKPLGSLRLLTPYTANVKGREDAVATPDKDAYATDAWLPGGEAVALDHLGTMGSREVYRLSVRPVAYNPVHGQLQISNMIDCELRASAMSPSAGHDADASRYRYFVVAPTAYRDGLQPFVAWKRQEGFDVEELYTATSHRDSVRALIGSRWGDNAPAYVLLVGDTAQIRPFTGTSRPTGLPTHATDLYFVEHTGDYLPDALVGRWPVADSAELATVVRKTVDYSRGLSVDTAQLRRVLLVAGHETSSPAPTTTNGQVNYLKTEIKAAHPEVDTLCYHNPQSLAQRDEVLSDIASGAAMLNYTAHCTIDGWTRPAVDFDALDSAGIAHPMLYVNNCCLSNDFNGNCLGERLLRKADGGAIGVIGATNSTLWDEDYYWAVGPKHPLTLDPPFDSLRPGAFDRWVGRMDGVETQGQLLAAGNMAVSAYGSTYDRFYWETYCLLGDPSLRPFFGRVGQAWIALDDSIVAGSAALQLHATPGATLTAVARGRLLGRTVADSTGNATMTLREAVDTGSLVLTATGAGLLPCERQTTVIRPAHGVAIVDIAAGDSSLTFTLANVGIGTLTGLTISLVGDSGCSECTEVAAAPLTVDTLIPGGRIDLAMSYSTQRVGQRPVWQATLTAADSATLCAVVVAHRLPIAYPTLGIDLLGPDGTPADTVGLGGAYTVSATVDGPYDTLSISTEEMADSVGHLHIGAEVGWQGWTGGGEWYVVCGEASDGFESGIGCYPWQSGGAMGWERDTTQAHSGRFSLRNGHITHRQTSELRLDLLLPHDDSVSYWYKPSSEAQADRMYFIVDGTAVTDHWGTGGWQRDAFALGAGRHTISWRYVKDASVSQGSDCVWIDDVRLPLALWDAPYGCVPAATDTTGLGDSTGIAPISALHTTITLSPNPASGLVTVSTGGRSMVGIELRDIMGRTVATADAGGSSASTVDIGHLPAGVYIVTCRLGDGQTEHSRLIVKSER